MACDRRPRTPKGAARRAAGALAEIYRLDALVALPGVGRKTADLVRVVAFGLPGLPVDTHVVRVSNRLGLTTHDDPVVIERELGSFLTAGERGPFALRLILHGRRVCVAKGPRCDACPFVVWCPSANR